MTEFRRDPLNHRWVVTGFAQAGKETDPYPTLLGKGSGECPFCEGKESLTPPETYAVRREGSQPNSPGWEVRVVPNRATDLRMIELQKRGQSGVYDLQNGSGVHETLVETPKHVTQFSQLPLEQMSAVLRTMQARGREHRRSHLLKGILIFRNQGRGSAGLFEHVHSQIVSLPFIPKTIADELSGARRYYELKNRCIFCDMITEERKIAKRVLVDEGHYFAWCPFASRFPFEVWIMPKSHQSEFLNEDPNTFHELSSTLQKVLLRIQKVVGDTPLSFVLHTAPLRHDTDEGSTFVPLCYHWHIELLPHPRPVGGFEWGGDFYLCPPSPEECAKMLLQAEIEGNEPLKG